MNFLRLEVSHLRILAFLIPAKPVQDSFQAGTLSEIPIRQQLTGMHPDGRKPLCNHTGVTSGMGQ